MKKLLPLLLLAVWLIPAKKFQKLSEKELYRISINAHEYSTRPHLTKEQIKQMPKKDRPDLAWEQNFLATMDPALGRPAPERLLPVYQQVAQARHTLTATPGSASSPWVERGPNNVAGRTRAIVYDPNDATGKKVWAGGVTGGLWYNNDISSASSPWVAVNDFWDNTAITSIAFDPTNTNTIYVGTGEGWGTGSSRGEGIWKSTNGGTSWTQLSASTGFYYVNDLAVRNENGNGVLYVAIRGNYHAQAWHSSNDQGLQRSTNGGSSFTQVMPNIPGENQPFAIADIEISANNTLWVGTTTSSYGLTDRGGGRILSSTNGTTWSTRYTSTNGERVEVACAPSNANYVYALIESGNVVDAIVRTTNGGTSWSNRNEPNDADSGIPASDFSRGQAWYDLIAAVDPNNANTLIVGGIDLFRSTDGANSWSQLSHWYGGFGYPDVHADQHAIIFKPGSSTEVLFGNDGGVYRSTNMTNSSPTFTHKNNGLNITQFYACAIHPTASTDYFLAGSQDNGSQQFNNPGVNSTIEVTGGDGAYCFIDQTNPNYQITSYVYNSYWLSTNGGLSFGPSRFQSDQSTGKFINPADYDDNQNVLYSARTSSTINRVTNITGSPNIGNFTVSGMSNMASHLRVSPYTTTSTTLFVGTEGGDLFKITNANGGSPSTTNISGSLPSGNISCVEIGGSENELLVTYTNYGVTSVWYTSNGGTSWVSKEGNLPDMPVRWALFNPNDRNEVLLATEVGVWSTHNFNSTNPSWSPSNSGLANVRVDMLQIRDSDKEVIAATYGRGLFSSSGFAAAQVPVANFGYSAQFPCTGETVQLGDSSTGFPTSRQWTITPNTFNYSAGSSATSQNPEVTFTAPGWYSVKLKVSNANGSDSLTITQAIHAGGHTLPFSEDFETSSVSEWLVDNPDNGVTWALRSVGGTSPGNLSAWLNNESYGSQNHRDGLITPVIDLTGYTQATLSFDYAYRRWSAQYSDSMAIYISIDCGTNWSRIASFKENGTGNFSTGPDLSTGAFVPASASDWCGASGNPSCPSISLNSYAGNDNVRIKFENITGWGNNLYIDNVNITGATSVAPVAQFSANQTTVCSGSSVAFADQSTNSPTGWSWSFSPATVSYVGGTSASSQNPQVTFNAPGAYQVSLTASNTAGSDAEIKTAYITVTTPQTPSVSINTISTNICAGSSTSFTALPTHGGSTPSYQWKINGVNAGTNSSTFITTALANSDVVSCVMTSSESCVTSTTATSNSLTLTVSPTTTPSLMLTTAASLPICQGTNITFTATATNAGTSPTYQWKVNGINAGTNSTTFSSSTLNNGDIVSVDLTSSDPCASGSLQASMPLVIVAPATPSVSISASSTSICTGANVTFSASPTAGGTNPAYQWKVNGVNAGTNSASFTTNTLANADVVTCVLTSSESCVTTGSATSNGVTITVNSSVTPAVSIAASSTTVCQGTNVTFNAAPVNGGATPTYQWKVNGVNVGSNSPNFSSATLANNDIVTVDLTSGIACASPSTISSTAITMAVLQQPLITINTTPPIAPLCKDDTLTLSATVNNFGQTGNGVWSGPGVQNGKFIASAAGTGTHTLTYTYTYSNPPSCSNSQTLQVVVENVPKPTITNTNMVLSCDQNGYNYQWMDSGNPISGATTQSYTVMGNGIYSVRIGLSSCSDQSDPLAIQNFGVEEVKALVDFKLYPNPTRGFVSFEMNNPGVSTISYEIIAFNGAVVFRQTLAATPVLQETIDLTKYANGMYTLRIVADDLTIVERIEKQ
jgi:PKD repeat protein